MTPTPSPRVFMPNGISASLEEYKIILQRKRGAIQQMCQGLEEFLTIELDMAIEAIEKPTDVPMGHPQYKPTDEEFSALCEEVATMEHRLNDAQVAIDQMSEDGPEGGMRAALSMQMQYGESTLRDLKQRRDFMQKSMEESEATS